MDRRNFLTATAALAGAAGAGLLFRSGAGARAAEKHYPVSMSEEGWRKQLTPQQFAILREEGTEPPFSSKLLHNERAGIYSCVGCDNPLYSSETKFDSGTGWPSFYAAIDGSVETKTDRKLIYARTEVHCARCGGHLGHIFDDGPPPTGKRHCIDGIVLKFKPASQSS